MSTHRSFEITINELRKNFKMNLVILRVLFGLQITIVIAWLWLQVASGTANLPFAELPTIFLGSCIVYLLWPIVLYIFHRRSHEKFREKTRRGATLITSQELQQNLPPGRLPLSENIILPTEFETTHMFIGGATGTGKTQCLSQVITQLRKNRAKAVIYDAKDGELVAQFYDPKTDFIYNPFDARSMYWNIFTVIQSEPDYDSLAASIIPAGRGQEKFFTQAGRDVLDGLFRYCQSRNARTNDAVWTALNQSIPVIHKMLVKAGSNAAATIENHDSVQSQGVISTLLQHAKFFRYLTNPGNKASFELREWLSNDQSSGFIFLNSITKQRESLKGIFTLFINSLAQEILSLPDNPNRRIYLIIDEFGTLHPLHSIKDLLALGRSKGCSFWLGIQEKAQIDALYGKDLANSITNQCNNYCIFRMNDSDSAQYFSRLFGEKENELMESTFSSGSRDSKDSESYRNLRFTDKLLLPSQVQALQNLSCYIKLSSYPLTLSRIPYRHYPHESPAFVPDERFLIKSSATGEKVPPIADENSNKNKPDNSKNTLDSYNVEDFNF